MEIEMKVYRLESAKGQGIFNAGIVYDARAAAGVEGDDAQCPYRHPSPYTDVPAWEERGYPRDFFCGFRDVPHLLRWFDSEAIRVEMGKLGAVMKVFEVAPADVLEGEMQIMFRKAAATLVDTLPVPTVAT
ncbi:hypothetical protein AB6806_23940 [Bosea sp. RCC_152_1]|uniref:hypothetical protein n=1 Tax=Bosea sp. RCC_152_1 TaxID=3239228 RepID=UPI003524C0E3